MFRRAIVLFVICALVMTLLKKAVQFADKQTMPLPLARVHDQYLYKSDLSLPLTESEADENFQRIKESSIQNWVMNRLLVLESEAANDDYHQAEIERKVLDYRYSLLAHSFLENAIEKQLDEIVTEEAINAYYKTHIKDFLLHSNIFKGQFVIVPKQAPERSQINHLLRSNTPKAQKQLANYCKKFAKNYSLKQDIWLHWGELTKSTSLHKKTALLKKGKLLQTRDKNYNYYFKIDECYKVGDPAPLELIKHKIVDVILYQRKIELTEKIKQEILQKAKDSNKCSIYAP